MSRAATISVILPTYRRPALLRKCLAALARQSYLPVEVCVGRRRDGDESAAVLREFADAAGVTLRDPIVGPGGNLVDSLNAALAYSTGDFVALTDDDSEAPPEWLEGLLRGFSSSDIGGVGGRDWQPYQRWDVTDVGSVRWWGKVVGNHHLGAGPVRGVDLLKGVNCCFRGDLLRQIGFDRRLRGAGNVSHWEMHLCFALRRAGWRLVDDPQVALDHHLGPCLDGDVNARAGFE